MTKKHVLENISHCVCKQTTTLDNDHCAILCWAMFSCLWPTSRRQHDPFHSAMSAPRLSPVCKTVWTNTCIVATSSSSFSMVSFLLLPLSELLQTRNGDRKYQTCLIFPMVNIKHVLTFDDLISTHSASSGVVVLMRHVLMMRVRSIMAWWWTNQGHGSRDQAKKVWSASPALTLAGFLLQFFSK